MDPLPSKSHSSLTPKAFATLRSNSTPGDVVLPDSTCVTHALPGLGSMLTLKALALIPNASRARRKRLPISVGVFAAMTTVVAATTTKVKD